jgi:hypothetical protein
MKKTLLFLFFALFSNGIFAVLGVKVVNVSTPGTLRTFFSTLEKTTVTSLTVTGAIDARDFKCMRDTLKALSILDLGGAIIQGYIGSDGTISGTNINYPANEIPANSFFNNDIRPSVSKISLTSIVFPTTVNSIGDQAFFQCVGLIGSLSFPSSVNSIGNSAFQECTGLNGSLILPNSLTVVKNCAFGWCAGFTELVMGSMVSSIESEAFTDCYGLKKISIARALPPSIAGNSFGFDKSNCTLYVPVGASSAYKIAENWSSFLLISEKNFSTEMQNISERCIRIYSAKSKVCIEGVSKNEVISIYSVNGRLLRTIKSQGKMISISLPLSNVYFVKTKFNTWKVVM